MTNDENKSLKDAFGTWTTVEYDEVANVIKNMEERNTASTVRISRLATLKVTFIKYKMIIEYWSLQDFKDYNFDNADLSNLKALKSMATPMPSPPSPATPLHHRVHSLCNLSSLTHLSSVQKTFNSLPL